MHSGAHPVLDPLNPAQREAVTHAGGPLLVIAGPGSGKTRVIAHRIAWLIRDRGVAPWRILAVTFTNRASRELAQRVEALIPPQEERPWASTFHSACSRILRESWPGAGGPPDFVIYDEDDQRRLMRGVLRDLLGPERARHVGPGVILGLLSWCKNHGYGPDDLTEAAGGLADLVTSGPYARARGRLRALEGFDFESVVGPAFAAYQERLREARALDFDDLLLQAVALLQEHDGVRQRYAGRFLHVLVDEYQDTNRAQYDLARLLTSVHGGLTAVGDPDQAIYTWRGADVRIIRSFARDFPDARTVLLEQNYRSTQTILDVADAIIQDSPGHWPRKLWTERGAGDPAVLRAVRDGAAEARFVREQILALRAEGLDLRDCAVLYRTHAQSRPFEQEFLLARVPYRVVRGLPFFERAEVKDILAYLRLLIHPDDLVSFARVVNTPRRGIGAKTLAEVERWARALGRSPGSALLDFVGGGRESALALAPRQMEALRQFGSLMARLAADTASAPVADALQRILEATEYEAYLAASGPAEFRARHDNLAQLLAAAAEYDRGPGAAGARGFLEEVALAAEADRYDPDEDAVVLMTLHAAKGLEFRAVFLVGMEEGLLPHRRLLAEPDGDERPVGEDVDEERRLCFVGVTRARDFLCFTRARERMSYGFVDRNRPSRYLRDIPKHLLTDVRAAPQGTAADSGSAEGVCPQCGGRLAGGPFCPWCGRQLAVGQGSSRGRRRA